MRRTQSIRNTHPRTSLSLTDQPSDLSTVHESSEPRSVEDILRKHLLEKERENDKVSHRPPPPGFRSFLSIPPPARALTLAHSSNPPSSPSKPNSHPDPPSKRSSPSKKNTKT